MHWWDVAAAQGGMLSLHQARLTGMSDDAVHRLTGTGALVRHCRGVYRAAAAPLTAHARLWGAVLATDGVIAYASAARLWGVHDSSDERVHVIVPHARRIARPPATVLHRVPLPAWAGCVRSGLPSTTRTWSVLDLLTVLTSADAQRLADRGVQRGWLTVEDIHRRLREQPCRTGNTRLRTIAAQLGDGAAAESERVLHRLLRRAGITGWVANHPIWVDGELAAVVDVALPALRVAIEVDGMAHHIDVDRFQRDRHRQNDLVALGWTVLRFTWWDLTERPGYVLAVLRRFGRVSRVERG